MAGDWIKVEAATLDKPEVAMFSELLGLSRGEGFLLLLRFWFWMDSNASDKRPGFVRNMSEKLLNQTIKCEGFGAALREVGWLKIDETAHTITVPHFERHNGNTAKSRASDAKRKRKDRKTGVRKTSEKRPEKLGPEKRREEKNKNNTPIVPTPAPGFVAFWQAWPVNDRKVNKAGCLKIWTAQGLETSAEQIVANVRRMRGTEQWRDFCPQPQTYLNQRRWEDLMSSENGPAIAHDFDRDADRQKRFRQGIV